MEMESWASCKVLHLVRTEKITVFMVPTVNIEELIPPTSVGRVQEI